MSEIKLPLILSVVGHAGCLALLLLFLSVEAPAVPEPIARGGIEVVFEPAPPKLAAPLLPQPEPSSEPPPAPAEPPPPPEPQAEAVPPPPEPAAVATEPAPPIPEAPIAATEPPPPPPPAPKHSKKPPKPVERHKELSQPSPAALPVTPSQSSATAAPLPQTASAATPVPPPASSPEASAGYRGLLSSWLESHKRYPDAARQRGEEGRAVLRFALDRSGRVLDYAVTSSTGYPDLDQSIEEMMRGATLPPFPAGIPEPRMEVSVTIRFSLRR